MVRVRVPWLGKVALIGGVLIALIALTAWLLAGKTRGAEIANVLALPVGLAGVVLSLVGLWLSEHIITSEVAAAAADSVRRQVKKAEWDVLQKLLADSGHARAANLSFRQLPRARTDGGDSEGSLRAIGMYYDSLDHGRMAVIGEPGAGKTVLAIQLMLDLIDHGWERVPVRFNLAM